MMNNKKIFWGIALIAFIVLVACFIVFLNKESNSDTTANTSTFQKNLDAVSKEKLDNNEYKQYKKVELEDGILYSIDGEKRVPDIIIGDNYFDTTINDMYLNSSSYENKIIEIEGMYLSGDPYVFVGRYSTSNICPYCPVGYSYIEYQLDGKIDLDKELVNEEDWIKVIGTLEKANDETSDYQDYYYLKVLNLEIMNERGKDTVEN